MVAVLDAIRPARLRRRLELGREDLFVRGEATISLPAKVVKRQLFPTGRNWKGGIANDSKWVVTVLHVASGRYLALARIQLGG